MAEGRILLAAFSSPGLIQGRLCLAGQPDRGGALSQVAQDRLRFRCADAFQYLDSPQQSRLFPVGDECLQLLQQPLNSLMDLKGWVLRQPDAQVRLSLLG